ncbi:VWA domain-containing protein [Comamonas testosteroni]|uniref:von Willebrand factor A n=1 Tax=Comamonas testosteroni TaxID=285 RepID=A0A096H0C6_COMTE|nr:VWA domain-containing protein [Comamonas testosteroni]KGH30895.1 von Willebrand factor A [Comamonas testosteroni]WKL18804.1 VWA domain-containing protein [Comamonas testosteroni]
MAKQNRNTIYTALPIVATAYGDKFGVKVRIGQDVAYTDGKTIVIPNVPHDYPNMDVVWGYTAHEAAHVRFTDFSAPRRAGLHAELTNAFEDCRIERAMMDLYPGTATTLNEVANYMAKVGHYSHLRDDEHPAQILVGYCLYWLQARAVGQPVMASYLATAQPVLERTFPQGVITRLSTILRKVVDAESTSDICYLADQVISMIEEEKEKEEEQQQQDQQNQDQSQQPQNVPNEQSSGEGDDSDEADGQQDSTHEDSQQGKGPGQSNEGDDSGEGQGQRSMAGAEQGAENDSGIASRTAKEKLDALTQALSAGAGDVDGDRARNSLKQELSQVARKEGNPSYQTIRKGTDASDDKAKGLELMNRVRPATSKIRNQLFGLVQASLRCAKQSTRSGKRLDINRLHRVVSGDTRVFAKPQEKRKPNTAVHILGDKSGSMTRPTRSDSSRSLADVTDEACIALALALDAIAHVNPAVTFFSNSSESPVVCAVKHGQSVQANTGRFPVEPSGGTPMAEAIWYAAYELSKTREDRKMLIVLTDGEPNSSKATKEVIDLCERSGIDVIGIGIQTNAPATLFSRSICIDAVEDLQKTLFKLMEKSLTAVD